jgi:GNAT superfamily N-acetyltransferase
MPDLHWLQDHPQHCTTMATWLYEQFHYEYAEQSLAEWQAEFAAGQSNGAWPSLVAVENGQLLGGAALAEEDLPGREDLGPWLACVFVTPAARGKGVAEVLIEGVCERARQQGVKRLYLHTQDRADYYAKRGWVAVETFVRWDKAQTLMAKDLQARS